MNNEYDGRRRMRAPVTSLNAGDCEREASSLMLLPASTQPALVDAVAQRHALAATYREAKKKARLGNEYFLIRSANEYRFNE